MRGIGARMARVKNHYTQHTITPLNQPHPKDQMEMVHFINGALP